MLAASPSRPLRSRRPMSVGLHVIDHRLGGRAAPELAFDHPEDTTLLARDEDPSRAFARCFGPRYKIESGERQAELISL
jgi:hypothetical protein